MGIAAEIEPRLVYITTGSREEAEKIARDAIEKRLAACANMISGMRSLYRWENGVNESEECILILKTVKGRIDALLQHVQSLHSHECPAILVLPVEDGNASFLSWLAESTTENR